MVGSLVQCVRCTLREGFFFFVFAKAAYRRIGLQLHVDERCNLLCAQACSLQTFSLSTVVMKRNTPDVSFGGGIHSASLSRHKIPADPIHGTKFCQEDLFVDAKTT